MPSYPVLFAVLSAVLGPGVTSNVARAQAVGGCTANSFTLPGWLVQDFHHSQASSSSPQDVSFSVINRAINSSAEFSCKGANSTVKLGQDSASWTLCSAKAGSKTSNSFDAFFQLNAVTASVLINETWSCGDVTPKKPIVFTAVGNSSLPLNNTSTPLFVKASLLSPVRITPAYVKGPSGHSEQGCAARSNAPSWDLGGIQLNHRTTAIGNGSMVSESLQIQVGSDTIGYRSTCGGFGGGAGLMHVSCQAQEPFRRSERYRIQTDATFDPDTVSIVASGSGKLPLLCDRFFESSAENVTFCTSDDFKFSGNVISKQALPAYSLTDPFSTTDSCTISSIVAPTWRLYDFETNSYFGNYGSVRFTMELQTSNESSEYPTTVVQSEVQLTASSPSKWYPCAFDAFEAPTVPSNCSFRYDPGTKSLALDTQWLCSDLDSAHPVTFKGSINTTIPELSCGPEGNATRCGTATGDSWSASIGSVSWH
ncbi:hypothetical protein GQ53DRAFT_669138 [Thozetella sp. PMI_491]|nr:hypothetical protein GQ53DRAFT_669138 [Thozetella sp. PMI_491]